MQMPAAQPPKFPAAAFQFPQAAPPPPPAPAPAAGGMPKWMLPVLGGMGFLLIALLIIVVVLLMHHK
jgi:hypothetical protein